jgi:20S proteasome alpha/beta subunit
MTIAIALMSKEGIVVAADTQEGPGYAGGLKTAGRKIENISSKWAGGLVVAGAGTSSFLDAVKAKVVDSFINEAGRGDAHHEPEQLTSAESLPDRFGNIVNDFYTEHVLQPFDRTPRNDFALLIAAMRPNGIRRIWTSDQTVLIPAGHFKPVAIGAGSSYALQMMYSFWPYQSMAETVLYAAYVIYKVKKSVESCGEYTEIVCIKHNRDADHTAGIELVHPLRIKALEPYFEQYSFLESSLLSYAIGRNTKEEDMRKALMEELHEIRTNIIKEQLEAKPVGSKVWKLWNLGSVE